MLSYGVVPGSFKKKEFMDITRSRRKSGDRLYQSFDPGLLLTRRDLSCSVPYQLLTRGPDPTRAL